MGVHIYTYRMGEHIYTYIQYVGTTKTIHLIYTCIACMVIYVYIDIYIYIYRHIFMYAFRSCRSYKQEYM
jgi:hypothetical protein